MVCLACEFFCFDQLGSVCHDRSITITLVEEGKQNKWVKDKAFQSWYIFWVNTKFVRKIMFTWVLGSLNYIFSFFTPNRRVHSSLFAIWRIISCVEESSLHFNILNFNTNTTVIMCVILGFEHLNLKYDIFNTILIASVLTFGSLLPHYNPMGILECR